MKIKLNVDAFKAIEIAMEEELGYLRMELRFTLADGSSLNWVSGVQVENPRSAMSSLFALAHSTNMLTGSKTEEEAK